MVFPVLADPRALQRGSSYPRAAAGRGLLHRDLAPGGIDLHDPRREEIVQDSSAAGGAGVLRQLVVLESYLLFELTGLHFFVCCFGVFGFDVFGCVDLLLCHGDGDGRGVERPEAVCDLLD